MVIGYTKFRSHIITIETSNYRPVSDYVYDYSTCRYFTENFKILSIENVLGDKIDKIDLFETNKFYENFEFPAFWLDKEIAFCHNFIGFKEYLYFKDGYSGYYYNYYDDGSLFEKFYHVNGIKF
jgi:hypothetical protein